MKNEEMIGISVQRTALIACEESQAVCKAYRAMGWEAYSCDLQEPSGGHPEWHILGDALEAIKGGTVITMDGKRHFVGRWDLLIAHPPCTYLCNVSSICLRPHGVLNEERMAKARVAKAFFLAMLDADVPRVCVENPVPGKIHGLPPYSQIIEPYMFGDPWKKRTCLWLRNLPLLIPTDIVQPQGLWVGGTSSKRKSKRYIYTLKSNRDSKIRAKTFEGIAAAMAAQWGCM